MFTTFRVWRHFGHLKPVVRDTFLTQSHLPEAVPKSWRDLQQLPLQQGHHASQHRQPGPAGGRRPHLATAGYVQDAAATGTRAVLSTRLQWFCPDILSFFSGHLGLFTKGPRAFCRQINTNWHTPTENSAHIVRRRVVYHLYIFSLCMMTCHISCNHMLSLEVSV